MVCVVSLCGDGWGLGVGKGIAKLRDTIPPPPQKCTGLTAGGRPSQEMGTGGVGGGGLRTGRAQIFDTNK